MYAASGGELDPKRLKLAFEVEIEEGEQLNLPSSIVQGIGKGKWVITIQPKTLVSDRLHSSFLNSYAPEDEGLYDDY
ncbi:hypothetical protein [Microcystis aeruginosa]|uniref:Uncharacterized protein n=1 Tax=Microcystis aeruginosa PCC 7806SL TaxID=1903187 RepID=A0AB33BWA7_MICA7|nr:hypothetical protein [Microcystis aeruginosa]ARI83675.1 hypothetical protein BH695_4396 [Microcystis aeruginosa PCC 7806SL]ELS46959.1 hypothetical protein C789_3245 [Microcystis aeruginosa FACHB-905 = DIANCHI905]UGS09703.1 hypothetical protein LRR78_03045 [Microcystis aeruginosa FACHB-905 = DIANCHI905]WKX60749.1 hypothetical protein Q3H53_000610 [Microcystis aeruginosa PCC 7806]